MDKFFKPSEEEITSLGEELKSIADRIVKTEDDKFWFVKLGHNEDHKKRERLAFILAEPWFNAPEVRYLNEGDFGIIRSIGIAIPEDTSFKDIYLVRLVQNHQLNELKVSNLNEAVAGELVFSLWIRRRDAHFNNRAYIGGVPMFFDHHIAFGAEEHLIGDEGFFNSECKSWRVKLTDQTLTTRFVRSQQNGDYIHYIDDVEQFKSQVLTSVDKIKSDTRNYTNLALEIGFNQEEANKISVVLEKSKNTLNTSRLLEVTTSELI